VSFYGAAAGVYDAQAERRRGERRRGGATTRGSDDEGKRWRRGTTARRRRSTTRGTGVYDEGSDDEGERRREGAAAVRVYGAHGGLRRSGGATTRGATTRGRAAVVSPRRSGLLVPFTITKFSCTLFILHSFFLFSLQQRRWSSKTKW
jgi:hypothetical protein